MTGMVTCACGCGAQFPAKRGKDHATKLCWERASDQRIRGDRPAGVGYRACDTRAERNDLFRALSADGLSIRQIALRTGWSRSTVMEVLNPEAKAAYNTRRARYMAARSA